MSVIGSTNILRNRKEYFSSLFSFDPWGAYPLDGFLGRLSGIRSRVNTTRKSKFVSSGYVRGDILDKDPGSVYPKFLQLSDE
ncbi:hypothetical protein DAPPUDRAFT_252570 [Daphnia pulex]|uniref:Uncharacterized protein n=1 Tax=Daphnia pulex TaxID=6669 RepID=E9H305_DAPPU|nr:hypothetical protein DAPPUDRAFT_252570 [Daphnia pulex]|eukprot:EFX73876.1 hypothetical protein DAPPUDRAFT_252570 [Daphnia pulex]